MTKHEAPSRVAGVSTYVEVLTPEEVKAIMVECIAKYLGVDLGPNVTATCINPANRSDEGVPHLMVRLETKPDSAEGQSHDLHP